MQLLPMLEHASHLPIFCLEKKVRLWEGVMGTNMDGSAAKHHSREQPNISSQTIHCPSERLAWHAHDDASFMVDLATLGAW
jgi:hypothetical protein